MISRRFIVLIVALCTIFTQWACQPKADTAVMPVDRALSITEAKAWLTAQKTMLREGASDALTTDEYWHLAQMQSFTNGRAVVVLPLTYGYQPATVFRGAAPRAAQLADVANHGIQSKLLIFKEENGTMTAERIEIIPTEANRVANQRVQASTFSGNVIRYAHLSNIPLICWTYRNGQLVGTLDYSLLKGGRQRELCTYFVSRKLGGAPPAQQSGGGDTSSGGSGSTTVIVNYGGEYYELTSYTAPCPDEGAANGGGDSYGGYGSPGGGTTGGDAGGGYGSGSTSGGGYTPGTVIYNEDGTVSTSAADNFINLMRYSNSPSIIFTPDEQRLIREYPGIIASLNGYINQYGTKPDGSRAFKLSDADQARFPNFTQLVRDLPSFVKNDSKVRNALIHYTGYSEAKLNDLLEFGHGPQLYLVENLVSRFGSPVYGLCDCDVMDKPDESKMQIEENYVRGFEFSNPSLAMNRATAFFLAATVLHEFVHYGRNQNQLNDFSYEFGESFELEAFGIVIGPSNAGKLSYRLYKRR